MTLPKWSAPTTRKGMASEHVLQQIAFVDGRPLSCKSTPLFHINNLIVFIYLFFFSSNVSLTGNFHIYLQQVLIPRKCRVSHEPVPTYSHSSMVFRKKYTVDGVVKYYAIDFPAEDAVPLCLGVLELVRHLHVEEYKHKVN